MICAQKAELKTKQRKLSKISVAGLGFSLSKKRREIMGHLIEMLTLTLIGTVLAILLLQWILKKITKLDEVICIWLASLVYVPIAAVVFLYGVANGQLNILFNGLLLHGLSASIATPFLIMRAYVKSKTVSEELDRDTQWNCILLLFHFIEWHGENVSKTQKCPTPQKREKQDALPLIWLSF